MYVMHIFASSVLVGMLQEVILSVGGVFRCRRDLSYFLELSSSVVTDYISAMIRDDQTESIYI